MSPRYLVREHGIRIVPRCDLPGSPYSSRKAAKAAARRAGIAGAEIISVRRES